MPMPYDDPSFEEAWSNWIEYRREVKKPYKSDRSIQLQLKWFTKKGLTLQQAIESIEESIRAGWIGIFEPKKQNNGQQATSTGTIQSGVKPGTSEARIDALRKW